MGYLANCSPSPFGEGWGEAAFYLPLLSERDGERLFGDMFRLLFFHSLLPNEQHSDLENDGTDDPSEERCVASSKQSPTPTARFALDGSDGGDAREVEKDEEKEAECRQSGYRFCLIIADTVEVSHVLCDLFV